ncbi:single-stranded DNA-binding protein [Sulfurimonas sp. SAG-AH-194-C21]|nr:single-stranded DNA-binding protein [Sulfurimonas sp. SAG-AH-194-C21]MDF1884127.1 single-stranded DNA-binding protein [Sulfurimonas sp. SAG-AH-194-C21]
MFNKVILVGNLTRDIEIKYSQAGMAIAKSAIATSRKFKSNAGEQKEEVCFVDITFFARSAEVANQYLRKGSKILVEGRLTFDQWTDQNGQKRSKHSVTVETMQMLGGKESVQQTQGVHESGSSEQAPTYPAQGNPNTYSTSGNNRQSPQMPKPEEIPSIDIDDKDIPF